MLPKINHLIPTRNDPCPCGSGIKAKKCCLISKNIFYKNPETLNTPLTKTGYAHSKCIASFTNDCSTIVSGEHYISRSVLGLIHDRKILVEGWPRGDVSNKVVGVQSLTTNCLCSRHNTFLSPLDNQARRFFETLLSFHLAATNSKEFQAYFLFNFEDLEKWLIKTLLMSNEAGLVTKNKLKKEIEPNDKKIMLETLFTNTQNLNSGAGFYFHPSREESMKPHEGLGFHSNTSEKTGFVEGCLVDLAGYKFIYSVRKATSLADKTIIKESYRPRFITMGQKSGKVEKVIDFSFDKKEPTFHYLCLDH